MVKRKVVCVFGKFDDESDFVLEPVCSDSSNCKICKKHFGLKRWKNEILHKM